MADEEQVDIVDNSGSVLRTELKTEAHKHGWLHKTVIGLVRYGDDWGLVRQASDRQDAGQLVSPVGGHVSAGETNDEALLRESDEEIGTANITYTLVGEAIFHRQVIGRDENHLFVVYELSTDDEIRLGHESVALERFTPAELKSELNNNPEKFGDALYFILEHFYPDYLPEHYSARWTQ
jgi:8-oxo-dGTP pyrophosphatase MutT (NUDIX family)